MVMPVSISSFMKVLKASSGYLHSPLICFGRRHMTVVAVIQVRKPQYSSMTYLFKSSPNRAIGN